MKRLKRLEMHWLRRVTLDFENVKQSSHRKLGEGVFSLKSSYEPFLLFCVTLLSVEC